MPVVGRGSVSNEMGRDMPREVQLLRRSIDNRSIAGVCGGIAEYFGVDATLVRVAYVLLSIFSVAFPGILIYILLWVLIPERAEWE